MRSTHLFREFILICKARLLSRFVGQKRFFVFSCFLISLQAPAQSSITGKWEGRINAGVPMRLVISFTRDSNDSIRAIMESPDQGSQKINATIKFLSADSMILEVPQLKVKVSGKKLNDSTIQATFTQGISIPLLLKKVEIVGTRKRPQTPVPPFPYESREVVFMNRDSSIRYGATITIPNGKGRFPAMILLTGSGQQNRDEEIAGHKPFAVIADHLTRQGYVVMRIDDRGMGLTTGNVSNATSADFAYDAEVGLDYLLKLPYVNTKKVGLVGHSEGGIIGQLLAAKRKEISFLVMLAGPGTNVIDLMIAQNEAILERAGMDKASVKSYSELYGSIVKGFLAVDSTRMRMKLSSIVDEWVAKTAAGIVITTTGIVDEETKNTFVTKFIEQLSIPWFRYFLAYDPKPNLLKMKAKLLALNGSEDIQVVAGPNLKGIRETYNTQRKTNFTIKELAGLNHLFQACKLCTVQEYGDLEETISPLLLEAISNWLLTEVGK